MHDKSSSILNFDGIITQNKCIFVKNYRAMKKGRGLYNDASEVVVGRLQLLEESEACQQLLKEATIEGIESGMATGFNAEEHFKALKAKRANG